MNTRRMLLTIAGLAGFGISTGFGQNWGPEYSLAPTAWVKTTVTTYTPVYQRPEQPPPAPQPTYLEPEMQPAYQQVQYLQPTYTQEAYAPPTYTQTTTSYVQPAYVAALPPQPSCVAQPVCVARPVAPRCAVYRPVTPTFAPATAYYPAAARPRVWVHEKVYVQGQPIRNLLRAITP